MNEELKVIITAEIADLQKKLDAAKKQVGDLGKKGEGGFAKFAEGAKKAGAIAATGLGIATSVVGAASAALIGLANNTREYRTEQAKLNTAFEAAGSSTTQSCAPIAIYRRGWSITSRHIWQIKSGFRISLFTLLMSNQPGGP